MRKDWLLALLEGPRSFAIWDGMLYLGPPPGLAVPAGFVRSACRKGWVDVKPHTIFLTPAGRTEVTAWGEKKRRREEERALRRAEEEERLRVIRATLDEAQVTARTLHPRFPEAAVTWFDSLRSFRVHTCGPRFLYRSRITGRTSDRVVLGSWRRTPNEAIESARAWLDSVEIL